MQTETKELLSRLTPEGRISLYAGLKRRDEQRVAQDALLVSDLLAHYLETLGLEEDSERVTEMRQRIRDLT